MSTLLKHADFEKRGAELLNLFDNAMTNQEDSNYLMPGIRAWLDEAPLHDPSSFYTVWGNLCVTVMHEHPRNEESVQRFAKARERNASSFFGYLGKQGRQQISMATQESEALLFKDGLRVSQYLTAMQGITNEELFQATQPDHTIKQRVGSKSCPVYDTLKAVFQTLTGNDCGASTPMLRGILSSNMWQPVMLLERLQACRQEQLDYIAQTRVLNTGLHYTAQGELLRVICAGTISTDWRPRDTPICAEAWHFIDTVRPSEEQKQELKARLLQSMPTQVDRALERVLYDSQTTPLLDMVFPLTICGPNMAGILRQCLYAFDITRHGAPFMQPKELELGRLFEAKLVEHHPNVAHLVHMHLSLFPEDPHSEENLVFLFAAGNDLLGFEQTSSLGQHNLPLPSGI